MKISDVIAYCDEVKPNAFSDAVKISWLSEVEGMIQIQIMLLDPAEVITYTTADIEATLLVAPPHDKLYKSYLCAMIDFANGEYDKYSNAMAMFNAQWGEYMRWYAQRYRPADGKVFSAGYYISAYGIAVKHGFTGTEEEWLASLRGETGPQGEPGHDFIIRGYYPTLETLITEVTFPAPGDAYGVGEAAPQDIYVWDGDHSVWVNNGSLQGPEGPQGQQGIQGPEGKSAYQLALESGFVGTKEEWLASLVGQAGPEGPEGKRGPEGPEGKSAYEVALANGFIGTEEEWLASLVGPQGPAGPEGPQGKQGEPGTGLKILGTYPTVDALASAVTSPSVGDMYNVGTAPPYNIYMWDGSWKDQGQLQGPAGASAYEVAVANGFVGTEQEWLQSLKGDHGPNEISSETATSYNGLLKGNGENVVVATEGTDYASSYTVAFAISVHDNDSGAHSTQFNAKEKLLKNLSEKSSIADNDSFAMVDSAASDVSKRTLWSTIKSTLKTYFDTLYNKYTHPTFTAKSSGLWKITVNSEGHVTDASAVQKSDIVNLGIPGQDTIYVHPTGDGNLHVPATSTNNNGKVLKAGATAGSIAWGTLTAADVGALSTSGGTVTGAINLSNAPTDDNHVVNKKYIDDKYFYTNATLDTTWTGSSVPYSKTVTVVGILATDTPIIDVVMSGTYETDKARQEAWAYVYRAVTSNNSITFYASEKPTVNLPVQIKVVR